MNQTTEDGPVPTSVRVPLNRAENPTGEALNVGTGHVDIPIAIDPDMPERGKYDYTYDGSRVIRLREWNEQVFLHELLHAALDRVVLKSDFDPHGHDVIAQAEVALWETGWRLAAPRDQTEDGLAERVRELATHNGTPVTAENLRYAATHEAMSRSWIFDVLTGLADLLDQPDTTASEEKGGDRLT